VAILELMDAAELQVIVTSSFLICYRETYNTQVFLFVCYIFAKKSTYNVLIANKIISRESAKFVYRCLFGTLSFIRKRKKVYEIIMLCLCLCISVCASFNI
jgi:hypothetical protein